MAKPILGIDLGTSNSAAAWVDDKGRVRVAAVRQDAFLLPSVVWYAQKGDHVLVGQPARQQLVDDPKNTIFGFKRFLGLRYNSPFVHRHKDKFAFEICEGKDGLCAVKLGDVVKPLEDVAVDVLKRLLELSAVSHGSAFDECVLAVPAHFGFGQRAVIRRAARRAGIKVRGMVNEPTAAAMYYAKQKGRDGTVLIFDLGGGTFDATLMAIVSGVVKVLATGGDAFLGGADFDGKLLDHLVQQLREKKGADISSNTVAMQRALVAVEAAKIELSAQNEVRVRVPCVALQNERFVDLDTRVDRKTLEDLTAPLVEKALGICEDILKRAELQPLEVDEVVFVGGMTRMPLIKKRIGDIFVANRGQAIHPDLGVVVGTALLSGSEKTLIDVNSMSIGLTLPGGVSQELVPANTPVPSVQRIGIERPPAEQPLAMGVYEAVDKTSLERGVLGTVRVPPEWLTAHPGPLALEAFLGADLELSLFLVPSEGAKLPLELFPAAPPPATVVDKKLNHPGFRSVDLESKQAPPPSAAAAATTVAPAPTAAAPNTAAAAAAAAAPVAQKLKLEGDKPVKNVDTGAEGNGAPEEGGAPKAGDVVGAYQLLDVIGRGGMGRVYLAEHQLLGRKVALKMLRRRMVRNRMAVDRFVSEARAVNQIKHENIIEVTDLFETPDGQLCTIMEVLDGRSLANLLKSVKAVRPERAVRIAYQVASAMVTVHDAHIIHRDIKPENIYLTQRQGRDDFVKLLDFGIAKLVDDDGKSVHDTGIGVTVGTRSYMSPEQLVGQNVDHRADIFSLGVVLYEILTGRMPWKSDTDRGMLFAQLERPPAPSEVPGLKHAVPASLSSLVMQMLENDQPKRPQTMREVKGRLEMIAESLAGAAPALRADDATNTTTPKPVKGGIDVFALVDKDTAPERATATTPATVVGDDSLPEISADDVDSVPARTATPATPAPSASSASSSSAASEQTAATGAAPSAEGPAFAAPSRTDPVVRTAPRKGAGDVDETERVTSSPAKAPPVQIVRTGVAPPVVVALVAAVAILTLLMSWVVFRP